jgi:peptidoglycan/LPS O-acetylase OafA/YrhL
MPELQSLRGIAAAVVLLHHGAFVFNTSKDFRFITEAIFNAHAAVMIFFVLSGYVLSKSLIGSHFDAKSISRFYIRRAFRIYPATIAVTLLSVPYILFVHTRFPTLDSSAWYQHNYHSGLPHAGGFALCLIGLHNDIIPPLWTIRVEILASLVLPLIAFVIKRGFGAALILATTLLLFAAPQSVWSFLISFSLGGYAAYLAPRIKNLASVPLLVAAVFVMYFFRLLSPAWRFEVDDAALLPTLVESLSAAVVVANIAALDIGVLRVKLLVWLGDISYSVYLVHFVIMSIWAKWIGRSLLGADESALLLMAATLLTTLPVAHCIYKYIELSGIELGKRTLDALMGPRLGDPVAQKPKS